MNANNVRDAIVLALSIEWAAISKKHGQNKANIYGDWREAITEAVELHEATLPEIVQAAKDHANRERKAKLSSTGSVYVSRMVMMLEKFGEIPANSTVTSQAASFLKDGKVPATGESAEAFVLRIKAEKVAKEADAAMDFFNNPDRDSVRTAIEDSLKASSVNFDAAGFVAKLSPADRLALYLELEGTTEKPQAANG